MAQGVPIYVLKRKDEKKRNIPANAVFSILEFLSQEQKKGIELIPVVKLKTDALRWLRIRCASPSLVCYSIHSHRYRGRFFWVKVKSTTTVNYKNTPVKHFKRP